MVSTSMIVFVHTHAETNCSLEKKKKRKKIKILHTFIYFSLADLYLFKDAPVGILRESLKQGA